MMNTIFEPYKFTLPTLEAKWATPNGVRTWWKANFETKKDAERYLMLVEWCHLSVTSFLQNNPEIEEKFLDREPGFMYFDIIKMCGERVDNWSKEACKLIQQSKGQYV